MKNLLKICSLLLCLTGYNAGAQEVVKVDTINGTRLQVSMDTKVQNALADMEDNCDRNTRSSSATSSPKPARVLVPNRELTNAEICRRNPRIL